MERKAVGRGVNTIFRVVARGARVFFGVLGALGGRANAAAPPPTPPAHPRREYRP